MKKIDLTITINGQPLAEFLEERLTEEIENVRVDIVGSIGKTIYHPKRHAAPVIKSRGLGRKRPGNPGVKKARIFTREEIAALNAARASAGAARAAEEEKGVGQK